MRTEKMPSGRNGIGLPKLGLLESENMKSTLFLSRDEKYELYNVQITVSELYYF